MSGHFWTKNDCSMHLLSPSKINEVMDENGKMLKDGEAVKRDEENISKT